VNKTFKITTEQFNIIYPVNINPLSGSIFKIRLFKYWSYSRIMELLLNKELVFVSPKLWKDPFEKMYLDTDYTELGFKQPKIYCFCVTTALKNEEAAWKIYSVNNERTLRCSIETNALFEILSQFAYENNFDVYFGNANYKLNAKEISDLQFPYSKYHNTYFSDFSIEKYLNVMTIKRHAFEYENELRIFMVPNKIENNSEDILRIKIPEDKLQKLFSGFTIQPFDPVIGEDSVAKLENIKNDFERKEIAKSIKLLYGETKVYSSFLYQDIEPIKKIYVSS